MRRFWYEFGPVVMFGGFIFAGMVGIFLLAYQANKYSCYAHWADSGYSARYGFWEDCMVKVNDRWMPEKSLRALGRD